jgi:hypothetical protein
VRPPPSPGPDDALADPATDAPLACMAGPNPASDATTGVIAAAVNHHLFLTAFALLEQGLPTTVFQSQATESMSAFSWRCYLLLF